MKIPKKKVEQVKLSVRVSVDLHAEIASAAEAQAWSVNAEINHRLRAGPILSQLRMLTDEVAQLRSQIESKGSSEK
ncbi:toxin-antitoxin system HicB family antitoxin [Duganella sp. LjRoot269]|uniref:toxin-antitoxin system HicB family antitoxin n=1 Tax=Duganella sp. LjRoot269 TaxID=3342305 RepID=UPI003ECE4941